MKDATRQQADAPRAPARWSVLPNGMEVAYQSRAEVGFFYEDIFEKEIYLQHGLTLDDGACVFDVGANVGFFTLFVNRKRRGVQVYAFEPAPPLFEILSLNVAHHGVAAHLFNCGLSNRAGRASFTFYPNSSGMSSFHADREEERENLRAILLNQARRGDAGVERLMRHADDLLDERLKAQTFECPLRTLSDVIAEQRVGRIDLMKIDVQKCELEVLEGIGDGDWPKIRQLVVEVHDTDGRAGRVRELLSARGFDTKAVQDEHYESSDIYNLYAVRAAPAPALRNGPRPGADVARQAQERARRQEEALGRSRLLNEQRKRGK
ncbi:MAG TPA: FkbM family methyltransferase [Pyrinomonadaceae bacterium]|jgi:FkbM family methyltransferase